MPLGEFEAGVLRTIAANRNPESYVAGASVLNQDANSPRSSRDIDLFHETTEALLEAFEADTSILKREGYTVESVRHLGSFARAAVSRNGARTRLEWVFDSAFRFFPLESDDRFGYRLNFWDAATNKILAAAGRVEARDYVDLIHLHKDHLPLAALVWAASGKDAGLSPGFILEELARVHHHPAISFANLDLVAVPDFEGWKQTWLEALAKAREVFDAILYDTPVGCFFLDPAGKPVLPSAETLPGLRTHFGTIRGCWPRIG